jgi:ArsR family transcriptional regulator, arsenate/arsenite/antimonite-responsive transcriptional repressor
LNASSSVIAKPRGNKVPVRRTSAIKVSQRTLYGLTQVFKLLSDESRLKILLALAQDGELHVSALCELLGQQQPAVSHHLTLLRMLGLVGYRRAGKHNFYRIESGLVRDLLEQFFADAGNGHKAIQFEDFYLAYKRK